MKKKFTALINRLKKLPYSNYFSRANQIWERTKIIFDALKKKKKRNAKGLCGSQSQTLHFLTLRFFLCRLTFRSSLLGFTGSNLGLVLKSEQPWSSERWGGGRGITGGLLLEGDCRLGYGFSLLLSLSLGSFSSSFSIINIIIINKKIHLIWYLYAFSLFIHC